MRLKQLLLLTLFCAAVRSNQYAKDYTCQHDGYSAPDGTCQCTDLYTDVGSKKQTCSQIQCVNSGVLSPYDRDVNQDQRCSCPPGFLGLHCEPVKCVEGDLQSFEVADHSRDVSIIITYNQQFQEQFKSKDKGPPIEKTICDAVYNQPGVTITSRVHFYVMENEIITDSYDDCEPDFEFAVKSCHDGNNGIVYDCKGELTTLYVMKAINQMDEDSRLIIIGNLGIDDFNNTEGIEAIRKQAISMRIQIHSLVISPREPQPNTVYFSGGLQTLRELSESTLGFFINPFDGSGGQKLGADGITQILNKMTDVFFNYVVVDRVLTTTDSCKATTDFTSFRNLEDKETTFWLTVISGGAQYTSYTAQWIGGIGDAPAQSVSAGFFNAYTLTVPARTVVSFKPYVTMGSQKKCVPSTILILFKSGHQARLAITNSDDFDATSPYAISGDTNTLVGHFLEHYHENNLMKLNLEFSSSGTPFTLNLDPVPTQRQCQYNARFGQVSCNDGDDTFVRVRDNTDGAAITVQNLYCTAKEEASRSFASTLLRLDDEGDEPADSTCKPAPITVKKTGRSLIVSAHATNAIYQLFNGNRNSAIRYLNDLDDYGIYDQYIINIYNAAQTTAAKVSSKYEDFKDNMMTQWHTYKMKDTTTPAPPLIVLLLGCEKDDFSDPTAIRTWQTLASKTGGFAVHFPQASDLNNFLGSYVGWVNGQAAGALDNMADAENGFIMHPVNSTTFKVKKGGNYTIFVNAVPIVSEITLSNGLTLTDPETFGNSIAKFDYTPDEDDTLIVTATPSPYYFYFASIRAIDLNEEYATIGFAKTNKEFCLEKEYPDFNPSEAQYPITTTSAEYSVEMSLFDNTATSFRNGVASGSNGNFELDYNWKCSDNNNIYYVSADVTTSDGSFSRVFTSICVGVSDGSAVCINGEHAPNDNTVCICSHDYTGDNCDIPVCQNGGSVTASLECDCVQDYSGFFCEHYDACVAEKDFVPDFKSIASTIIFVVEQSEGVTEKLQSLDPETFVDARAAQYIVVQYGTTDEYKVLLSTTDKAAIFPALNATQKIELPTDVKPEEFYDPTFALAASLDAQVTGSAQVFWFAETDRADYFADFLFDQISHQRVSISALFTRSVIETPIHPVQVAGGSVFYFPTDDASNSYQDFFTNYVVPIVQFQSSFELRPNLLASTTECNAAVTVNIDQSAAQLFVAANGENTTIEISSDATTYTPHDIPGGKVFTFNKKSKSKIFYDGAGAVTVTIKEQDATKMNCSTTVTAFSQNQVGYGFIENESDSKAMIATGFGEHLLVTYWTSESVEDTPTPTAVVTPISLEEGFGNGTEIYATVRNGCSFSLSIPVDCSEGVNAVGVTVSNYIIPNSGGNAYKVDKYFSVLCPAGECVHGNTTVDGCVCEAFWGGTYCTENTCKHGEIVGDDCMCYNGYKDGDGENFCDVKIDPNDRPGIAYLFIQDVCGSDADLKLQTQSILANFMDLLTAANYKFYLGTNNPDQAEVQIIKDSSDLRAKMAANDDGTGKCSASLGVTLDSLYLNLRQPSLSSSFMSIAAAADPSIGKARVAHVTTVGIDSEIGDNWDDLYSEYTVYMEIVGFTDKNAMFTDPDSFKIFTPAVFTETYDPEVALLDLVNTFPTDKKPVIPPTDSLQRCIQNLQADFAFHTDISSAQKVIQNVVKYFDIPAVKNIDLDDDTCEFNKDQLANKTQFYGVIYANSSGIGVPTFCMSNMNSYPSTVATTDYKQAPQVMLQSVIDSFTKWYNTPTKMMCHCFDYENLETTKIIMWTPLSKTSLDTVPPSFAGFDVVGFKHIVMPFGFGYDDSPLWRGLVPDRAMWTRDASLSDYDVDDIIQDIWTITCKMAGHIQDDQTAEPFNPYTTKKPRVQGDDTKNNIDGVTDDPSAADDDSLPR
ncbi:hypothetical protein PRIPAC_97093 [Pristionchus pacificus]|uniref:Uncharacterized protein n=1 Tax=Pristionchus pacificus TaxID=54126 RepID=A0A2A6CV68_PRIPA|nr:hypothetical protein PRIPAC_97093 [Pristionchus pacificus]|eukprot:PDM81921.1 hypothetical protein PRIPAC_34075 [Pristionchus pacificus]